MAINFKLTVIHSNRYDFMDENEPSLDNVMATFDLGASKYYRKYVAEIGRHKEQFPLSGTLKWNDTENIIGWLSEIRVNIMDIRLTGALAYLLTLPENTNTSRIKYIIHWE